MRKKGDSELIAEILLIVIVIMIIFFILYFFLGYLEEKEERMRIQNNLNDPGNKLDIDDLNLVDNQKLTLVLGAGEGGHYLANRTNKTVSHMNITMVRLVNQTNITHSMLVNVTNSTMVNVTNSTLVNVTNSTIIYVPNSTLVNGSNADIVTVNDVSGSMDPDYGQGDKISELRNASKEFVQKILNGTNNQVGLVAYHQYVENSWSNPLTNNTGLLLSKINSWTPLGSTCICCGIERGISYLSASTRTKIMIVLSDGGANEECSYWSPELSGSPPSSSVGNCGTWSNDACDDAINYTKSGFIDHGILTYSIGFGTVSSVDSVTLKNISLVGNGSYYFSNLNELSDIFANITQNITWMEGINVSFNQTINVTFNQTINVSWLQEINVSWNETVNITWIEQINETINETVEIEIYAPEIAYDYLKIVFYAPGKSCSQKENISAVPGPHETTEVNVTLSPSCGMTTDQLTKIEIYAVALTSEGEEIISSAPIAVWEKAGLYARK